MKKTLLLVLSILLCTLCFGTFAYAQNNEGQIVYLSDNGSDSNDGETSETPFLTAEAALSSITGDSATLCVTDTYTVKDVGQLSKSGVSLIVEGYADNSTLYLAGRHLFEGDVYFRNINIVKTGTADMTFWAYGNNVIFGEGVSLSSSNGKPLKISQGEYRGEAVIVADNSEIILNDVGMSNVYIASHIDATVKGSASVTINNSTVDVLAVTHYGTSKDQLFGALGNFNINVNSGYIKKIYPGGDHLNQVKGLVKTTINGGTVDELYTVGRFDGQEGIVITEINGGTVKKIAVPVAVTGSEVVLNIPRAVILNNGVDATVSDTSAIVLKVAEEGKAQAVTTEPTEENGWTCNLLGFEVTLPEGKEYVYINGELAEANEVGLYVIDEAGEYTVTFGGKYTVTIGDVSEKYTPNTVITLPAVPAKEDAEHYTFKWSDGENEYDAGADYTVTGDVTFIETWTPKNYTIIFKNGDETVSSVKLAYGSEITIPDAPQKDGHSFDGWWYNGEEKLVAGTTVSGDATYIARFNVESYDVEISAVPTEGGTVSGAGRFEYGTKITLSADASFGYALEGWYDGETKIGESENIEIEVLAAKTYTAKFVATDIEIKGKVILVRKSGSFYNETYEDGSSYNNAAVIKIYNGDVEVFSTSEDIATQNGEIEFTFNQKLGKYRVVIEKNGYVKFSDEIEIKNGTELSDIKLVPGDIKGSYDDNVGDGKVDVDDFVRILRAFSNESSDKLRHAVDINEDRVVNVEDIAYVKAAIGK